MKLGDEARIRRPEKLTVPNVGIGEAVSVSTTVTVPATTTRLAATIPASSQFMFLQSTFTLGQAVQCSNINPQLNASAGWITIDLGNCRGFTASYVAFTGGVVNTTVLNMPSSHQLVLTYSLRCLDVAANIEGAVLSVPQQLLVSTR